MLNNKPRKKSFFEKLTGAINTNDFDNEINNPEDDKTKNISIDMSKGEGKELKERSSEEWMEEEEGQLEVDVFQNPGEIIVKAMVAGVRPDTLDIQISRDMVTIRGTRQSTNETREEDYFYRELYWGTFSRTILLPAEVEVEEAEATEEHGMLTLHMPKIDKDRKAKLKVRSSR
jgi:HSP20 family protein